MPTKLEICNGALQKIGAKRIQSLAEQSDSGRICNSEFTKAMNFILRLYPFSFATKRAILAPDPVAPLFEYTYQCQLPADFLRLVSIYEYHGEYRVEGRMLLCDTDSPQIKYISNAEDVAKGDTLFAEALEWHLAYNIARYLTESETIRNECQQGFRSVMPFAKFVAATEHSQAYMEANDLIDARTGRGFVRDPGT